MNELNSRWSNEPQFRLIHQMLLDASIQPTGKTMQEWYITAPKTAHPVEGESVDARSFAIENCIIRKAWWTYVLDGSSAKTCTFEGTRFQGASAANCDFTASRFIVAQMSPIYAPDAIFKDCVFESCFLMGIGPRNQSKGAFSDLMGCDFSGVRASNTAFGRCDLRGAKLSHAHFIGCEFSEADLRAIDLTGTRFENCEFFGTQMDDTPTVRALVQAGNNLELNAIQWAGLHPPASRN